MAEQAYAYVTLIPVAKGFQQKIANELKGAGGKGGVGAVAGKQTGTSFVSGFGGAMKALAATVATGFLATKATQFFKNAITEASDLGESINAVNVSYLDYADDVLALGEDVASRLGLATVDFNAAAVRFSAFAERVVGQGGDVAGFVDDITTRAADFASVFNIEVSEALQVFQSGLAGEAEPLKRFGINLLDSEVKAYALRSGLLGLNDEYTETIKVQARFGLLMEATNKTAGDFANTSDGLANSTRILQANFKNLQARVGDGLTPVMAKVVSALVPLADYIFPKLADFMNNKVAPAAERLATNFRRFVGQVTTGYLTLDDVIDRVVGNISGFFGGGGLTRMLQDAFMAFSQTRTSIFNAIMDALPGILDAFAKFLPQLIDFLLNTMLPQLLKQFTDIVKQLVEIAKEILPKVLTVLMEALPDLIDGAFEFFMALVDTLIEILPDIIETLKELFPMIVTTLINAIPQLLDGAIELFLAILDGLLEATPDILDAVIELVPKIAQALLDNLPTLIEASIKLLTGIATAIIENGPRILGGALKSVWQNAISSLGIGGSGGSLASVSGSATQRSASTTNTMTSAGAVPARVASPATFVPRTTVTPRPNTQDRVPAIVYNAAPNKSIDSEADLRKAIQRSRVIGAI